MKRLNFQNKTAIITGASSGIGKELCRTLITKYNCTVFAIARNEKNLEEARKKLGDKYVVYPMDVSLKENWIALSDYLKNNDISVDILINCAGILPKFATVENTDVSEYEKAVFINYLSQVYACKTLLPIINEKGAIVNVASSSALCPFSLVSAYTASKSASYHFSQSIAQEIKTLSVSCILCGFVKTDIMKNQSITEKEARLIRFFSSSCEKTVKKILRRVRKRKKRIVTGIDAHLMSIFYRLFPNSAPRLISWFLKKSGLNLFNS